MGAPSDAQAASPEADVRASWPPGLLADPQEEPCEASTLLSPPETVTAQEVALLAPAAPDAVPRARPRSPGSGRGTSGSGEWQLVALPQTFETVRRFLSRMVLLLR